MDGQGEGRAENMGQGWGCRTAGPWHSGTVRAGGGGWTPTPELKERDPGGAEGWGLGLSQEH